MCKKIVHLIIYVFLFISVSAAWATDFSVNTHRFDPYKQFKFRVKWDGRYISGINKIDGLLRTTQTVAYREGNSPNSERKVPGTTKFEPLVLERGRTHDTEFEKWANKVYEYGNNDEPEDYRKDIMIELYNEAGQLVMAFKVYRCWPSRYSPIKILDANSTDIATEVLVLEYDGWQRDMEVQEPTEQSFREP